MLGTFLSVTGNDFIDYDDQLYVTENAHVQGGLTAESIKWAFTSFDAANWHPLTWLSHMLDCQLFGLRPGGHHLTSVMIHLASTLLLFVALRRMTGSTWRSFFVAAFFGLHPLRVESVAWVAERKDVLAALFWMLALYAYAAYAEAAKARSPQSRFYYIAVLVCFVGGLLSKPMVVTLPFVLLLLDYWPLMRIGSCARRWRLGAENGVAGSDPAPFGRLLLEKGPLFALAAISSMVTFLAQKHGQSVLTLADLPFSLRIENALVAYCRYLGKLFWPADLIVFYPFTGHWAAAAVVLAALMLIAISVLALLARRRTPYLLAGWLWFLGTLVPVIGIIQVGDQSMADRYSYIPSIGILIALGWGCADLAGKWRFRPVLGGVGLAVALLCALLTRHQLGYWKDSEILFRHVLAVSPENYIAHRCLGAALAANGQFDEAALHFQEEVRLNSGDSQAHTNLGLVLAKTGRRDEAIREFREAVQLEPDKAGPHLDLGAALCEKGLLDEGIAEFREALKLDPNDPAIHCNLARALSATGRRDEAIQQLREALKLHPDLPEALKQLRGITNQVPR